MRKQPERLHTNKGYKLGIVVFLQTLPFSK